MKHNWEHKRLKDVCYPKSSIGRASSIYSKDDIIEYIDISSINKDINEIAFSTPYCFGDAPSRAQQCVKYFDVVVSLVRPNLKNIAIVKDDRDNLVASSGFCVLRGKTILPKLIFYIVNSQNFTDALIAKCAGAAYPAVKDDDVKNSIIPVPPMAVQEQIVAELDKINEVIADCRELLRNLDALAQSLFYDTFGDPVTNPKGWEVSPLKDAVIEMFLGPFGSALKTECHVPKEEGYAMVYEQKHAIKKTLNLENHYIGKAKFDSLKRFEILPNDFIMSCRGTIGQLYQVPDDAPRGIIHPSVMKIRLNPSKYNASFFSFLLPVIIKEQQTKGNCVQMAITAKELGTKKLPAPPMELQQKFAAQIERIEMQKKAVEATIAELQTLLDSRMDYWFN